MQQQESDRNHTNPTYNYVTFKNLYLSLCLCLSISFSLNASELFIDSSVRFLISYERIFISFEPFTKSFRRLTKLSHQIFNLFEQFIIRIEQFIHVPEQIFKSFGRFIFNFFSSMCYLFLKILSNRQLWLKLYLWEWKQYQNLWISRFYFELGKWLDKNSRTCNHIINVDIESLL